MLHDIRRVGAVIERSPMSESLVARLEGRLSKVHDRLVAAAVPRPRVAVLEWTDPIYNAGHWVPQMVRRAGGIEVLGKAGERSRMVTMDELVAAKADTVIFAPCGYGVLRAAAEGEMQSRKRNGHGSPTVERGRSIRAACSAGPGRASSTASRRSPKYFTRRCFRDRPARARSSSRSRELRHPSSPHITMLSDTSITFLKRLLDTPGPSGFESAPARVWREEAAKFAKVQSDVHGNSMATVNPDGRPVDHARRAHRRDRRDHPAHR